MPTRILGVIPARFASSRFPGKALAPLAGKPILQHVYERASQARYLSKLVIATDDDRIAKAARSFGAPVQMTRPDHPSGTDRVAEVASSDHAQVIVNIQGDEPLIDPGSIDAAALALLDDPELPMATLKKRIEIPSEIDNPNVVKVVSNLAGDAIYFSRCPIPYLRGRQTRRYRSLQTHWSLCIQARIPACLFRASSGSPRAGRAAGAVAGHRKRISHPRGGNRIRVSRRGYSRRPGAHRRAL